MGNIFDLDNYTDAVSDAADWVGGAINSIGDAGKAIGSILKFVAPIVAMWPGIGTALSVALSVAGSIAVGQRVDDALIDTASAAIPGGLPRVGFNSAVAISKDLLAGRNAFGSVVDACRSAAQTAGGDRALQAFDTGLGIARGNKVSAQTLALARSQVAQSMGTEGVAAFDASVAVAQGEGADAALLVVARDYIAATGNPLALAAFDTGVALAHGQALQDAGFAGLQALVYGNESGERAVMFLQKIVHAAEHGNSVWVELVTDLAHEVQPFLGQLSAQEVLQPFIDAIKLDPSTLAWGSQALADAWGEAEPLVRAAQAIMRDGQNPDTSLAMNLNPGVKSLGRVKLSPEDQAKEDARWAAVVAANPGVPEICLRAKDARARNSPAAPNLEAQCAEYRRTHLAQAVTSTTAKLASGSALQMLAANPKVVMPVNPLVPFAPVKSPLVAFSVPPVVKSAAPSPGETSSMATVAVVAGGGVALGLALWFALRK